MQFSFVFVVVTLLGLTVVEAANDTALLEMVLKDIVKGGKSDCKIRTLKEGSNVFPNCGSVEAIIKNEHIYYLFAIIS